MKKRNKRRAFVPRHPIHAMELALQVYESASFAIDLIAQAHKLGTYLFADRIGRQPIRVPFGHSYFRDFLLDAAMMPFDIHKIEPYGSIDKSSLRRYPDGYQSLIETNVPASLYRWNAFSRRVFELSEDLLLLLENTDVRDVRIADVPWPFSTFAITAPCPPDPESDARNDCILVSVVRGENNVGDITAFHIRIFPAPGAPNLTLSESKRAEIQTLFRKRRWMKLGRKLIPYMNAWSAYQIGHFGTPLNISVNTCFEEHFNGGVVKVGGTELGGPVDAKETVRTFRGAINLAIGLSFYLTTVSKGSSEHSHWEKLPDSRRTPDPRSSTNPAQVCTVSTVHRLTAEERAVFGAQNRKAGHQLCAHFRRGHWRKPPGSGDDPTAEKIIWVRPTLVRRDRLGPGELPGGAKARF